ncbi:MAG: hypothetical protein JWP35_4214 [Caulobacter sp.]|nr:hypothetical protein [Caulobacter sp.]
MTDFNVRKSKRKSFPVGLVVLAAVVVVAAGAVGWMLFANHASANREPLNIVSARAIQAADCSWLVNRQPDAVYNDAHILLGGASGASAKAVDQVHTVLAAAGYGANKIEADAVKPVDAGLCKALDSVRQLNTPLPVHIFTTRGSPYKIGAYSECPTAGMATVAADFPADATESIAVIHLGHDGIVETMFVGREGYAALQKSLDAKGLGYTARTEPIFTPIAKAKSFVLNVCENGKGAHGILMLRGDPAVLSRLNGVKTADDLAKLNLGPDAAKAGVKAQLDWNQVQ